MSSLQKIHVLTKPGLKMVIPSPLCRFLAFRISILFFASFFYSFNSAYQQFSQCLLCNNQKFQLHTTIGICFWFMHLWVVWAGLLWDEEAVSTQGMSFCLCWWHISLAKARHMGLPKWRSQEAYSSHQEAIARVLNVLLVGIERQWNLADMDRIFFFFSCPISSLTCHLECGSICKIGPQQDKVSARTQSPRICQVEM